MYTTFATLRLELSMFLKNLKGGVIPVSVEFAKRHLVVSMGRVDPHVLYRLERLGQDHLAGGRRRHARQQAPVVAVVLALT